MTRRRPYASAVLLWLSCHAVAAADLVDPTRPITVTVPGPAAAKVTAPAKLRLDGILYSMQREVAIVNGRLVHAGDWLGDAHIEDITRNCVRYTRGGHTHVLTLSAPMNVRRSPAAPEEKR